MFRFLPLALLPLLIAGVCRREFRVSRPDTPRFSIPHGSERGSEIRKESDPGTIPSSPHGISDSAGATLPGMRKVVRDPARPELVALSAQVRDYEEKLDAYRAKIAKLLNNRGPGELVAQALVRSLERATQLEAELDVLKTAYVELQAEQRRAH